MYLLVTSGSRISSMSREDSLARANQAEAVLQARQARQMAVMVERALEKRQTQEKSPGRTSSSR